MNRIRTWLIRLLQGEAKSAPPHGMSEHLPHDHPRRGQMDGIAGPETRVALARIQAGNYMPRLPGHLYWKVRYDGAGSFQVELWEYGLPDTIHTQRRAPMAELKPETIIAMARDTMHWRNKF